MEKTPEEIIHDHFSDLGKKSHRVSPRGKKYYSDMGKKSAERRKRLKRKV